MCVLNSLMSSEHLWGDVKFFQSGCKNWFCPILTKTGYCELFNFSQYGGVKWYPIVVLTCIYWWVMMLSAFSYAHQSSGCWLSRSAYLSLLPIFKKKFVCAISYWLVGVLMQFEWVLYRIDMCSKYLSLFMCE